MQKHQHQIIQTTLIALIITFVGIGIACDGVRLSFSGFLKLQFMPARLLSDFIEMQGIGAAFLNAAAAGLMGLVFILLSRVTLSGVTFAAILTILGFGLFGKTPLNIFPIIVGVFIAARIAKRSFKEYLVIALFGTALGPFVSFVAFELGTHPVLSLIIALAAGIVTGLFLPAIAVAMLNLHQGYNLYNIGLTCGFFGLFLASLFKFGGVTYAGLSVWHTRSHPALFFLIPGLSMLLIITGLLIDKKNIIKNWLMILNSSGRLPSDFFSISSLGAGYCNAGLMGLIGFTAVTATSSHFNGPVLGGILTLMGFGAFGNHPKNSLPIMAGVVISALSFSKPLNSPGVILAILFGTTLAPLSGQFGFPVGIIAGFIHMIMVSQTGAWHGAMNLYNNGFAGGVTATFLVALLHWISNNTTLLKKKVS